MVISASRRTDIPAFYSDWFFGRIREGFVRVRNPMNPHQVSEINLSPDAVDAIVFWTKDPTPMLGKLGMIEKYNYYFQFTLTSYGSDIETCVPRKSENLVPTFQKLSELISPQRVIWRYDPIILTEKYTVDYHLKYFEELAKRLSGHTEKCVVSFLDIYKNTRSNLQEFGLHDFTDEDVAALASGISRIARGYGMKVESCAEKWNLEEFGISHGHCVDSGLISSLSGRRLSPAKDRNQRAECGCAASVDIGLYNSCPHGCKYCYANYAPRMIAMNRAAYDKSSPLLCSSPETSDRVTERKK